MCHCLAAKDEIHNGFRSDVISYDAHFVRSGHYANEKIILKEANGKVSNPNAQAPALLGVAYGNSKRLPPPADATGLKTFSIKIYCTGC